MAPVDLRLMAALSGEMDGLNVAALCRERGISRKTFYKWKARYEAEGLAGLEARSRRPKTSPTRVAPHVEAAIIDKRKWLSDYGLDAGPASIQSYLKGKVVPLPSEATIWRVLARAGFIVPEPKKRPRSSWVRFQADTPNECWQIDSTEWALADGSPAAIFNILDDNSRLCPASEAVATASTEEAWRVFSTAGQKWGLPARCLSDNGLSFSGKLRGFEVAFEANLRDAGVRPVTSRPYHPQTCGKVERFQQTLKRWLAARPAPVDIDELNGLLEEFVAFYNNSRPHRALGRRTPMEVWSSSPRARPGEALAHPEYSLRGPRHRLLKVNSIGTISLGRYQIALGRDHAGLIMEVETNGVEVVIHHQGELVRRLILDPTRNYQPSGRRRGVKRKDGS